MQSRRRFLATGAGGLLATAALQQPWLALAAKKTADSVRGRITITTSRNTRSTPTTWTGSTMN